MAKYWLLVVSDPMPGREDEYNRWYSEVHLGEVLQLPGFVGARRFQIVSQPSEQGVGGSYVALYEMETDDPEAAYAGLGAAVEEGRMVVSGALDLVQVRVSILRPI